jgi:RNA polymerase sigma-70 factor (ECF subfamily)
MLRLLKGGAEASREPSENPQSFRDQDSLGAQAARVDPLGPLAAAAAGGDRDAQRTLLVTVGPSLLRVVRGVLGGQHTDVEDVLQETMVSLHLALVGFRGECTTLHFACRIAVQTALNARRRSGHRMRHTPNAEPADLAELARDDRSPADAMEAAACRQALRELLGDLPPAQAEVLALHTLLGYTVEETAQTMAVPINTVRSRLRAALATLRTRVHTQPSLFEMIEGGS